MNDRELDRLVAATSPARDAWIASLDLRDAEIELLEEIMATETNELAFQAEPAARGDAAGQRRYDYRWAVAAAIAAVLAVAGVGLWFGGDENQEPKEQTDVATEGPTELPRLLADELPDGFELLGAEELAPGPLTPEELEQVQLLHQGYTDGSVILYGDPDAADPLEVSDLVVYAGQRQPQLSDRGSNSEPITVRGRAGTVQEDDDVYACYRSEALEELAGDTVTLDDCPVWATTLRWVEGPGFEVSLRSHSLTREQLVAVAEDLTIDGESIVLGSLPPDSPGPLEEVGRADLADLATRPRTHRVTYEQADGHRLATLDVTMSEGDIVDVLLRSLVYERREPVEVRGHTGWPLPETPVVDSFGAFGLVWLEAPGVVVEVEVVLWDDVWDGEPLGIEGPDPRDLLPTAESLRPATEEEWTEASGQGARSGPTPNFPDLVASYVPDDAVAFVNTDQLGMAAYLRPDGQVCAFLVDDEGKHPDTCGPGETRVHELRDPAGNVVLLFGRMPEGATDVAITGPEFHSAASAFHDVLPEEGPTLYAYPMDLAPPDTLTFRDAQGQPVETVMYP